VGDWSLYCSFPSIFSIYEMLLIENNVLSYMYLIYVGHANNSRHRISWNRSPIRIGLFDQLELSIIFLCKVNYIYADSLFSVLQVLAGL